MTERRLSTVTPIDVEKVEHLAEDIVKNKKTWMVALDGSDQSFEALDHAINLMDKAHDHLCMLHVCVTKPSTLSKMTLSNEQIEEWRRQTIAQGEELVWKAERIAKDAKVITTTSQNREADDVKDEIVRECTAIGVNYLVMGSRGMGNPLGRLILGSTTEHCIKNSPVPVLIVKKTETHEPGAPGTRSRSVSLSLESQPPVVPAESIQRD
eukprot:TRINITY_DN10196_c0_g1_i1.p1 TRINITY_DN10196_c0_g1~~TRINITY_DN10196_c0_g1_i1.p1  ORF type:complete len:234 (-),score=51.58 TRINITY_DN10196_c0_g1_i1:17-646(-)